MKDKTGTKYLTIMDIVRTAGLCVLPPCGAWVCIKGCPIWPRGKRIIPAHIEVGIRHLDIYWGYKEALASTVYINRFGKFNMGLVEAVYYDVSRGADFDLAIAKAADDLRSCIDEFPFPQAHRDLQTTLITISHPHPEEVRFFNGEVTVFDADFIRRLLQENLIEPITFAEPILPILEDIARDLVEALQLDGLSKSEAYQMIVAADVIEPEELLIPTWFYRPINEFREIFVEEHDYVKPQ